MTYALRTDPTAQLPLAMNLFEAHHLDGQHLSDRDFLTYQAMLFNLFPTGTQARQWLDSDECDAEVRRAYSSAHRLGVTGVPFFVFQQKYAASGAMGIDEFVKVSYSRLGGETLLTGLATRRDQQKRRSVAFILLIIPVTHLDIRWFVPYR